MSEQDPFGSDVKNYSKISALLLSAMVASGLLILLCNVHPIIDYLRKYAGPTKALIIQLYLWGALGGTIAAYKFFATDKDINEVESRKEKPDLTLLRFPDKYDVQLYIHRIVISGFLGLISGIVLYAGLGYFDTTPDADVPKHKAFFAVFALLAGMQQNQFIMFLKSLHKKLTEQALRSAEPKKE